MRKPQRNARLLPILQALAVHSRTFTECQRIAFKSAYPNEEFTHADRGWYTCMYIGPGTYNYRCGRRGILNRYATRENGRYFLNDAGWDKLQELEAKCKKPDPVVD